MSIIPHTIPSWSDYELIDSGEGEKLERFGKYVLSRPEPQAIWQKSVPNAEWDKADAHFKKTNNSQERGEWIKNGAMPDRWMIHFELNKKSFQFRLALTAFKHVGIFPEQAANWAWMAQKLPAFPNPKILNLFAYTGAASIIAKGFGAEITHVDAVKPMITWSKENMEHSNLKDIRWVVEDARKFVSREAKRGNIYHGIILDPPAYGRGPKGEKWLLEEDLPTLLENCSKILAEKNAFLILNLYSMGLSPLVGETLIKEYFNHQHIELGELYIADKNNRKLPLSTLIRFSQ